MKVPVDYQLLVVNAATVLESTFMCWYVATKVVAFVCSQAVYRARAQDDWVAVALSAAKRLANGDGAFGVHRLRSGCTVGLSTQGTLRSSIC